MEFEKDRASKISVICCSSHLSLLIANKIFWWRLASLIGVNLDSRPVKSTFIVICSNKSVFNSRVQFHSLLIGYISLSFADVSVKRDLFNPNAAAAPLSFCNIENLLDFLQQCLLSKHFKIGKEEGWTSNLDIAKLFCYERNK